jgi:hypothetical protein
MPLSHLILATGFCTLTYLIGIATGWEIGHRRGMMDADTHSEETLQAVRKEGFNSGYIDGCHDSAKALLTTPSAKYEQRNQAAH